MTTPPTELERGTSLTFLLGPLTGWLADGEVTEIAVNRPGEVFVERKGRWERHPAEALTLDELSSIATAIAAYSAQEISDTRPVLSATLPAGQRVQVVQPPACEAGTISLTIRKPSQTARRLSDYEREGFFNRVRPASQKLTPVEDELLSLHASGDYAGFLLRAVRHQKVIVVAGETGSGKTTLMKALMEEIDRDERIITIEDVPELVLPRHPNHIHLFYPSEAKEEENAAVTAASLLKSALRMRPDRILLAELRGGETYDFLNVAASGHRGSITSCHAGSAELTWERLALMVLQNRQGRSLPYEVIRRLLYLVVDVIVHVHNSPGVGRHITEIWFDPTKKRQEPVVELEPALEIDQLNGVGSGGLRANA